MSEMTEANEESIWRYFDGSKAMQYVKDLLSVAENVVVVLGESASLTHSYKDTTDPLTAAAALQRVLVQSGKRLHVGDDGRRQFAFLAWKRTDPINEPSHIHVVRLLEGAADDEMTVVMQAVGAGEFRDVPTLDEL